MQSTTANYRAAFERDIARRCYRLGIPVLMPLDAVQAEFARKYGNEPRPPAWFDVADDILLGLWEGA
jgi:hypothetical protein